MFFGKGLWYTPLKGNTGECVLQRMENGMDTAILLGLGVFRVWKSGS